ncbi:MAG: SDR family NAD(P)-dependent oxidoreductase, partial [Myxococcales bacterium]|nr:SDR family NAD(P)-dependent oxidoreductase [Myxococcales bacterium]
AGETPRPAEIAARLRSVRASREIRATLSAITGAGAEARYVAVDVTDGPSLTRALDQVRAEWGPIAALVHGAGVIADKPIAALDDAAFDRVFDTKITGLRALLAALTPEDPLRVLCLFSSVSARCGNNGQSAYAMANEVLNKLAQCVARTRAGRTLVKALDWGPWEGGMVSPELRAHFERLGVPMIPLSVGARMFVDELRDSCTPGQGRVELVLGGEPRPEALLSKGTADRILELEVHIGRSSHGYLADHAIAGTAVVPVVLVIEWFSRIARAFRPDLRLRALERVQVLSGVKLNNFDAGGDRFTLRARQLRNGDGLTVGLELVGEGGKLHYRAQAAMAEAADVASREAPQPRLRAWDKPRAELYGDVLFHGDDFQVIEALEGVGEEGIAGWLRGVHQAGWAWDRWQTDVAAHDGGLQLAVLWARAQLGRATLPMGVDALTFSDRPPHDGPIRCVARCRETSASRALADLYFLDESGACLSEWRGAELVSRPDMPTTRPG